jgi:phytoene/squalene synthetase/2-polyprenyl-6-methoxyphenol hydroxylase-like FAD-dependent oxidoreductase
MPSERTMTLPKYDVVVVGGGPVGLVTARAFSRRGARILVLEADPRAATRLAGEWLHPRGRSVLESLDLDAGRTTFTGRGFVVYPDDGRPAITLPYPGAARAISFPHHDFVEVLRRQLTDDPYVDLRMGERVLRVAPGTRPRVHTRDEVIETALVVGADGRRSVARAALGDEAAPLRVSRLAGLILHDVELPFEEHGHVFVGGPGPILAYRIGTTSVRLVIDVPISVHRPSSAQLFASYARVLPSALKGPFKRACGEIEWAEARFRPRALTSRRGVALVGDAAGCVHPLTAMGLTLGFEDGARLGETGTLRGFTERRERETFVPELLSDALYEVMRRTDDSATAVRQAMFALWRDDPRERERTMNILGADETRLVAFGEAFMRVAFRALAVSGEGNDRRHRLTRDRLLEWMRWPSAALAPAALRRARRAASVPRAPLGFTFGEAPESAMSCASEQHVMRAREFCRRSLEQVSRTFARPIELLPEPLRSAVTIGYLLCRIVDTIEDHPDLTGAQRDARFAAFLEVIERGATPERFTSHFADTNDEDPEIELSKRLGDVLTLEATLEPSTRDSLVRWAGEMCRGMAIYARRPVDNDGVVILSTEGDLERYCFFVAGTVGHMLTELFEPYVESVEARQTMRENAESFAMSLQLVNILKDVTEDLDRGACFLPRTAFERIGLSPLDSISPQRRPEMHGLVAPIIGNARAHLERALDYSLAIPPSEHEIRLFCLIPLFLAVRTLAACEGNDDQFTPRVDVKIGRAEVESIVASALQVAPSDAAVRELHRSLLERAPYAKVS